MIAIVRYNAGNIRSVINALERLGVSPLLTDDPKELQQADKVIFPGVGEASSAMQYLRERGLDEVLKSLQQPFLGICLGMQLMCRYSEENDTECLGIFPEAIRRFPPVGKVPHMGWNDFQVCKGPLFKDIPTTSDMYFAHSYYAEPGEDTVAQCHYLVDFGAALARPPFYGVQFHPEKSGKPGEQLLHNFLAL